MSSLYQHLLQINLFQISHQSMAELPLEQLAYLTFSSLYSAITDQSD
jgi:hypothetical protein